MCEVGPSILVAACGNIMASDDAFGPLVARELRHRAPAGIEATDLDIRPAALLDYLPGKDGLILIDAVHAPGLDTGELIDIDWFSPDRPALINDDTMSTHGLSLAMQLNLAKQLDLLPPRVRLIAVAIELASVGQPISDHLPKSVVAAADLASRYATLWTSHLPEQQHA